MRKPLGSRTFDIVNACIMVFIAFVTIYPIWYVLIHSFNNGFDSIQGGIYWWPREFTTDNYREVFRDDTILRSFGVTILRTVIATITHVFFTAMTAYAFLNRETIGRKLYMGMGIVTMFFSGGLIPTFILIKNLGLFDRFWVYVFPTMFWFYDLLIFQAFFRGIPSSIEESAKMDGANSFTVFCRIIIPISGAVFATMALFNGVYNWNDYFMAIIYTNSQKLHPIQTYLYKLIVASEASKYAMSNAGFDQSSFTSTSLQMATMMVTTIPIVCVYPFLQRHFVKGVMLGSVKG